MMKNANVDKYFAKLTAWQKELTVLREILLNTELKEEFKWYHPCYTYQDKNVIILGHFKNYCTISFFKGALIKDAHDLLVKPGINTQSDRVIKFETLEQINDNKKYIEEYILRAIEVEKQGLNYDYKSTKEYVIPEELALRFNEQPDLKQAFDKLTPGRQHGYILYFSGAKQPETRYARIDKHTKQILEGKGLEKGK